MPPSSRSRSSRRRRETDTTDNSENEILRSAGMTSADITRLYQNINLGNISYGDSYDQGVEDELANQESDDDQESEFDQINQETGMFQWGPPGSPPPPRPEMSRRRQPRSTLFEEDTIISDTLSVSSNSLSDELITDNTEESCASLDNSEESNWIKSQCNVCQSLITLDEYTSEDYFDLTSIKIYNVASGKFGKGQCILRTDVQGMLSSDLDNELPKYIYTIYKQRQGISLDDSDSRRGLGTSPTENLVIQLNLGLSTIFVTLGSIYTLFTSTDKVLYAAPLYNGLRRRIGNLQGNLMIVGANHGQVPGFLVYKLFTREDIESGVNIQVEELDFDLPLNICRNLSTMLNGANNPNDMRLALTNELITYLVELKQGTHDKTEYHKSKMESLKNIDTIEAILYGLKNNIELDYVKSVINFQDEDGDTVLHYLVKQYHESNSKTISNLILQVLKMEPDINIQDENRMTALMYALNNTFMTDDTLILFTLLDLNPNLNIQDNIGRTSLMYALYNSYTLDEVIFKMLKIPQNINIRDSDGETAFRIAIYNSWYDEIINALLKLNPIIDPIIISRLSRLQISDEAKIAIEEYYKLQTE